MTYTAAVDFLFGIRLHGQKLGLDTMRELLRRLGDPQRDLRFLHIAGTNGKGSVAAMLAAVLNHAGYRTALYTSPHLVSFCERFQIGGQLIAEADVARWVQQIRPLLDDHPIRPPTFFEVVTALALAYFREQRADPVVWETGLGGRLDATNVVTPLVSIITTIALDHQQYLGDTLTQIAAEKAGIIKPGVPVVTAAQSPEALTVIRQVAHERGCRLTEVCEPLDWEVPLPGDHQRWNCATAVAALRATGLPVSDDQIRAGLKQTRWPGRFQVIGNVVLDGAHNPAAAEQLAATLQARFPGKRIALILGVLRDKDYRAVCRILAPVAERVFCVPVQNERSSTPEELAAVCGGTVCRGLAEALTTARSAEVVVITGSLFLVGEALQLLGVSQPVSQREPGLQ